MLSLAEDLLDFLSENELSELVGDVGERGDLVRGDLEVAESGGERGDDRGEVGEGEKRDSSLGVFSILMMGGTPSTDFDLLPALGEGDLDLRTRLDPKLEL